MSTYNMTNCGHMFLRSVRECGGWLEKEMHAAMWRENARHTDIKDLDIVSHARNVYLQR